MGDAHYRVASCAGFGATLAEAEDAYRAASLAGRQPQPGLALLRLAQGRLSAAEAAIRRVIAETTGSAARARVLGPYVEITLELGNVVAGRAGADELSHIAAGLAVPVLRAVAAQANGSVLLAEGVADRALPVVAEGLTNKEIASTLVVGEHTVARHLQTSSRSSECPPVPRPARPPTGLL